VAAASPTRVEASRLLLGRIEACGSLVDACRAAALYPCDCSHSHYTLAARANFSRLQLRNDGECDGAMTLVIAAIVIS